MNRKIWFFLLPLVAFAVWSCNQTPAPSTPSTGSISFAYSGGGCNIVTTLDGGSPVTETATTANVTLYSGVQNGTHSVAIMANGNTNTCNINVQGTTERISASGVCSTIVLSCP